MSYAESQGGINSYSNEQYVSPSIIQIRLDTTRLLKTIENYLKGKIVRIQQNPDGSYAEIEETNGKAILNPEGIQSILSYMNSIINSSVVQGNYTKDQYFSHLDRIHASLTRQIIINREKWDLEQESMELLCDYLMNLMEPYLSRLIDNKERDGFSNTLKTVENNTVKEGKGFSLKN